MPRARRISFIGRPHIVVARGNSDDAVFFEDDHYLAYLACLRDHVRSKDFKLFAYGFARDEVRLVIQPERFTLGQVIQRLHTSHARRVNAHQHRRGHLFEGRFRSIVIRGDQLASTVRAIHLWPVRSGRVRRAETYPWSSHRAYVKGGDEWSDLVDAWTVLADFGDNLPAAQRAFERYTESAALDDDNFGVTEVFPGVAGPRPFAETVLAEAGVEWRGRRRPALATVARRVTLLMNVGAEDLVGPLRHQELVHARRLFATYAVRSAGRSVSEVAKFLHRDKAQVSRLVGQGIDLLRDDEVFRSLHDTLRGRNQRSGDVVDATVEAN